MEDAQTDRDRERKRGQCIARRGSQKGATNNEIDTKRIDRKQNKRPIHNNSCIRYHAYSVFLFADEIARETTRTMRRFVWFVCSLFFFVPFYSVNGRNRQEITFSFLSLCLLFALFSLRRLVFRCMTMDVTVLIHIGESGGGKTNKGNRELNNSMLLSKPSMWERESEHECKML